MRAYARNLNPLVAPFWQPKDNVYRNGGEFFLTVLHILLGSLNYRRFVLRAHIRGNVYSESACDFPTLIYSVRCRIKIIESCTVDIENSHYRWYKISRNDTTFESSEFFAKLIKNTSFHWHEISRKNTAYSSRWKIRENT